MTRPYRRKPASFWIVIAAGTVLFGLYPFAGRLLVRTAGREVTSGWTAEWTRDDRIEVVSVDADGPAAGTLRAGDRILSVNDNPPLPRGFGWVLFMDLQPGDPYTLRVMRGTSERVYPLTLAGRSSIRKAWLAQVPLLLISFSFYATGFAVGLIRPGDRVARRYTVVAFLIAAWLIPSGVFIGEPQFGGARVTLRVAQAIWPLVLPSVFQFFSAFPPGVPLTRGWSLVRRLLYGWAAVLLPGTILTSAVTAGNAGSAAAFIHAHASGFVLQGRLEDSFTPIALLAVVAIIVRQHVAVIDPLERRRLRWIFWGSAISATPFAGLFVVSALATVVTGRPFDPFALYRAQSIAELFLLFLPVTFAYAVIAHRVIGVDVVIRRGVRYLLAKNVLRAGVFLPLVLLGLRVVTNPDRTVAQLLFDRPFYTIVAAAGALGLYGRERLSRWLDRQFFREAFDREQILLDLGGEIERQDVIDDLAGLVGRRIEASLHPRSVHLFLVEAGGGDLRLAHSSSGRTDRLRISANADVVRLMNDNGGSVDVSNGIPGLPAEDVSWLTPFEVGLIVAIGGGRRRLSGLLLLGEKQSEEPYAREDRRLLEAVAVQMAIASENASLRREAALEAKVRHTVLAHVDAQSLNLLKECPACGRCYDRTVDVCAEDGRALTFSLPVDRTIDARYRLDRLLGRGGMGAVYEATDLALGRGVAVKIMTVGARGSEETRRRFEQEARASARLRHRNIVTVHDYGSVGPETTYLVMELLGGTTLRGEIRRTGGVTADVAAIWFDQILDAMKAAHAAGVIHRDLKPENIFLTVDERGDPLLKVLDFGLAKLRPDAAGSTNVATVAELTAAGSVLGTLAYMSPEQLSGARVDEGTDLFAVGVMVVEALTGRNPFRRDREAEMVAAILHDPAGLAGDTPEIRALDDVVQRCLAKERRARFASAAEMQAALIPALRREGYARL